MATEIDIVMKWDPSNAQDNSNSGHHRRRLSLTATHWLASSFGALTWDRTFAPARTTRRCQWRLRTATAGGICLQDRTGNQGWNRRVSEARDPLPATMIALCIATAPATYWTGPEYLTVFRRSTGKGTGDGWPYPVPRGRDAWGDGLRQRVDRFNGGWQFVKRILGTGKTASGRPSIL